MHGYGYEKVYDFNNPEYGYGVGQSKAGNLLQRHTKRYDNMIRDLIMRGLRSLKEEKSPNENKNERTA